jgi:hypothetical protein
VSLYLPSTHSAVRLPLYQPCSYRLSLYLPTLLSGSLLPTYPVPTLLSEFPCAYPLLCHVSLYLPTLLLGCLCINPPPICCPCTYPLCSQISLLPTQNPLCCQIFPTHSAVRFFLQLSTLLSDFSCPYTYSAVKFSIYVPTHSATILSLYLPHSALRLLFAPSLHFQGSLHLLTLLSGYSRQSKLCCKGIPCTYKLRLFPIPLKFLSGNSLYYKLCCDVCPCTLEDRCEVAPVPTKAAVRLIQRRIRKIWMRIVLVWKSLLPARKSSSEIKNLGVPITSQLCSKA